MDAIVLNRDQPDALYLQIVQAVRDQIAHGALRPGDALPTVRDLARQLQVNQNTVNRAYRVLRQERLVDAHRSQGTHVSDQAQPANLQATREHELHALTSRLIADARTRGFTLAQIEASFVAQRAQWQERERLAISAAPRSPILGLGSHDLCLELLLAQLQQRHPNLNVQFGAVGSLEGLMGLARGEAHFAAAHLYDPAADDYNAPFVRRLMPDHALALITLAQRTQGLIVAGGNPRHIRALRDLTRRDVRFVNRQRGSGTRVLLDTRLRKARIAPRKVRGYAREEQTHVAVAAAVAGGAADVGLGIQSAARSFGLDFVPLARERYEIIMPRGDPFMPVLLDCLGREDFRQAAQALGGYDLGETGRVRYV